MPEIKVKYQGQVHTIQWDKSTKPTKEELLSLIKTDKEPSESGYFQGLKESVKGLLSPVSALWEMTGEVAKEPSLSKALSGYGTITKNVAGTLAAPAYALKDVYNTASELEYKNPYEMVSDISSAPEKIKKFAGIAATKGGESLGIPVSDVARDIQEGKYLHAAGLSTVPAMLSALSLYGFRAPKGELKSVPSIASRVPEAPVTPTELQVPPPIVTTKENLIAAQPFTEQINPAYSDLRHGLSRPTGLIEGSETIAKGGLTAAEHKKLIEAQKAAVKKAEETRQIVNRPVVAGNPQAPPFNPVQSIIPERLREPGMNQVVFDALVPPDLAQRSKYKAPPAPVQQAAKVLEEVKSKPEAPIPVSPEMEAQVLKKVEDSWFRDVYDRGFTSVSTQLANLGSDAKGFVKRVRNAEDRALANLIHKTRTEANQLGGQFAQRIKAASKGLSKEDNLLAFRILDGTAQITDTTPGAVKAAVSKIRMVTDELGKMAEDTGIHIRVGPGESVPFKRMEGPYAHHMYPEGFFNRKDLTQRLIDMGKTAAEAQEIVEKSRTFGERFISPTHAREFNMPGYIESLGVMEKYAYEMAERITQAKNFGVKDIAPGADTPLNRLIAKSSNPEKAHRLLTEYLNRGVKASEGMHKAAQKIVKGEVLSHLSLSAINQLSDLAGVPVRTGFTNFAKGVFNALTDYQKSVGKATESGALAIMKKEILKDISQGKIESFAFGLSKMEEVVRTVSAMSGRASIQDLFSRLKKNPADVRLRKEFRRLLDEDVDSVIKQNELTEKQINLAAGRTVELINSIPDKLSLPPAFTYYNPITRLPFLFKRFAFTTTKNLADAIIQDPKRIVPALLSYGLVGEVVGDIKASIGAASRAGFQDKDLIDEVVTAVANRDKKSFMDLGHPLANRALANLSQAWFLGLFGDLAESVSRGSRGVYNLIGGPVIADAVELVDAGRALASQNMNPAKKFIYRRVPFIGQGIAEGTTKKKGLK